MTNDLGEHSTVKGTYVLLTNSSFAALLLAAIVATFIAVATVDLLSSLAAKALFRVKTHQAVVADSMLLIAGAQFGLSLFMLLDAFYDYAGMEPNLFVLGIWPGILRNVVCSALGCHTDGIGAYPDRPSFGFTRSASR